jgi:hypothetical protein
MDRDMLTEILAGRHFNMPDRVARGAWPHEPLAFSALVQHLSAVISSRQWFPGPFQPAKSGEWVADVTVIENIRPDLLIVHVQRSGASGRTIAESFERRFSSPVDAADFFLRTEHRLPGDLDGWKVIA